MNKVLLIGGAVVLATALMAGSAALAMPPSKKAGKSDMAQTLLTDKVRSGSWPSIWPGAFGLLKYSVDNPNGFEARLIAHGLLPNEWYMVTFQGPWDGVGVFSETDTNLWNSNGLWGGKLDSGLGWTDLALFQTNAEGNANVVIPTSSGLGPNQWPLYGMNTNPTMAEGLYEGVRVVVKRVGNGAGWFDVVRLMYGTDPVLFEYKPMEDFEVGTDNGPSDGDCTTIQDGVLMTSGGELIVPGYDNWGYNYQAHMFNGGYCDAYRDASWCQQWKDVNLIMKWNEAWLGNMDCDGDGLLDRHFGYPSYIGSGAWLTNHQWGTYKAGGKSCHWDYFVKIVAPPSDAYKVGGLWYTADGVEIGSVLWGDFAIIQSVYNDPCGGFHGIEYLSPASPGFGSYKP